MPMNNLIEYKDIYSKTSASLWQYHRLEPEDTLVTNFELLQSKVKVTKSTPDAGNTKNVETAVPLKYFSNFGELWKCD